MGTKPLAWQIEAYRANVLAFSIMATGEGVAPIASLMFKTLKDAKWIS
jgi:hypothetical protein